MKQNKTKNTPHDPPTHISRDLLLLKYSAYDNICVPVMFFVLFVKTFEIRSSAD